MQDKEITKVYQTNDYDKFKLILGNRCISLANVNKIQNSIATNGFKMIPILVNENFEIIDGQHRFEALKNLNKPIYYIIENGLDIEDCKTLNINTKNWSLSDYLQSYSDRGYSDYVRLNNFVKTKNYPLSIAILLFSKYSNRSSKNGNIFNLFKEGNFEIFFSESKVEKCLEIFYLMQNKYACHKWFSQVKSPSNYVALRFFLNIPDLNSKFDLDRFLELLETKSNNLVQAFTTRGLISSFGDFYNKGLKQKFDFESLYEEYKKLIPTGIFLEDKE